MADYIFDLSGDEITKRLHDIPNKVDKENGKGLSTEDFTSELLAKLKSLSNYNDTELREAIAKLRTRLDTLVEGDTSGAIDKFNEIIAFLDGIEDSQSLDSIIASIERQIAMMGNTLSDKVDKVEGKGLSTEDFTTSLKQKLESLQNYDDTAINKAVSGILELVNDFNQDISNLYNTKQDSCYILPFDLVDLTRVVDGELDAVAFTPDLFDAIQNNRLILLPKVADEPNGYQAVTQANYYADDVEMYLTIVSIEYDIRISGKFNDGNYLITSSNIVLIPKQKPITDLDAIRQGASRGATSVQGVKLNGSTITRKDENGIVDLGNIEGGGEKTSEEEISEMGFTKNKGTVTNVADVQPDEYGHISAEELSKKLNIGSDTATSVNFANDLTGRIEATPEEFTYRPSADNKSVRDESAVIRRIKGNTSVWGQGLNLALDQTGENGWWFREPSLGGDVRIEGNTIKYDVIPNKGMNQQISQYVGDLIVGNTYLLLFSFNNNGAVNDRYNRPWLVHFSNNLYGTTTQSEYGPQDNATKGNVALFKTIKKEGLKCVVLKQPYVNLNNDEIVPTTMEWSNIQLFNLTQMFGAGNEPTTYEEFRQYYPDAYYPYCAPEIRSMRATGIETVGFNLFDEYKVFSEAGMTLTNDGWQGEVRKVYRELWSNDFGYNGQICVYMKSLAVNGSPSFRVKFYYTDGTTSDTYFQLASIGTPKEGFAISDNGKVVDYIKGYYDNVGDVLINKLCINLSHSGVRNGEYKPYEKNTLLLPEIAKYFPDGMHGIGDVCDEINEEMAIQRCAMRAYEEGDENNAEVKTDRITTVYKLAVPVYTPIDEPLQLAYKVDDFGTEKMLSDVPSSPFKADIVYQFNAEGRIRDNSRNIEKLEEAVKKLENNDASSQYAIPRIQAKIGALSELLPNVVYDNNESTVMLHIPPFANGDSGVVNKWIVRSYVGEGCEITYPTDIRWKNGTPPTYTGIKMLELIFTDGGWDEILGEWSVY